MSTQNPSSFPKLQMYVIWLTALCAMLGSLFFSEVLKIPPCDLCWYQRIFLYPLCFLIPIAVIKEDLNIRLYLTSLLIPGTLVTAYHNLLYYGILEKPLIPCREGISCTSREYEFFGFLGIPLLSLIAYTFIGVLLFTTRRKGTSSK